MSRREINIVTHVIHDLFPGSTRVVSMQLNTLQLWELCVGDEGEKSSSASSAK